MTDSKCVSQKECAGPQQCEIAGECLRARFAHETAHVPSEAERVLARIVDAYDARSELFTSDEICAGALADIARHYLARNK